MDKKSLLLALSAILGLAGASVRAGERTLAELKNGSQFEVLESYSAPIPPALRFLGTIPPLQASDGSFGFARSAGSSDPVCIIRGLAVNADTPDAFSLPKGSTIDVSSVKVDKKGEAPYAGPMVAFAAKATGTSFQAFLRCYGGKGSKIAMTVEFFEKIFRRKIRLLVPKG